MAPLHNNDIYWVKKAFKCVGVANIVLAIFKFFAIALTSSPVSLTSCITIEMYGFYCSFFGIMGTSFKLNLLNMAIRFNDKILHKSNLNPDLIFFVQRFFQCFVNLLDQCDHVLFKVIVFCYNKIHYFLKVILNSLK